MWGLKGEHNEKKNDVFFYEGVIFFDFPFFLVGRCERFRYANKGGGGEVLTWFVGNSCFF